MRRREFISLIGGAAATWPYRACAATRPVIGFLHSESSAATTPLVRAFRLGLGESGYVEGKNVVIEYRWAESQYDRLPALAADLVRHEVDVIAANGPAIPAAKAATTTIPIVFFTGGDPVKLGLVASLARPGGNLTGVTNLGVELGPKRLELLRALLPKATTAAVLVNPTFPAAETQAKAVQAVASTLSLQLHVLKASNDGDIERIFPALADVRAEGLVAVTDPFFNSRQERLAALSLQNAMPMIYHNREFVAAGGLAGYGDSSTDLWRQIGAYAGRILKGEKPSNLPVQQPSKFEFLINLKTAKALGLTIPQSLLATADEAIE